MEDRTRITGEYELEKERQYVSEEMEEPNECVMESFGISVVSDVTHGSEFSLADRLVAFVEP